MNEDDTPNYELPEQPPVLVVGPWSLYNAYDGEPDARVDGMIAAMIQAFPHFIGSIQDKMPLPEGVEASVILAGEQAALDWNGSEEALGFQAIMAEGTDPSTGDDFVDLPDDHRCYLNLTALIASSEEDEDDRATRMAAMVTLPFQIAQVALFANATEGRTPLEIYDDGEHEALSEIMAQVQEMAVELAEAGTFDLAEDSIEKFARAEVDSWVAADPVAGEALDAIALKTAPRARKPGR